eukprot:267054_1
MPALSLALCLLAVCQAYASDYNQSSNAHYKRMNGLPTSFNATYSEADALRSLYFAYGSYCNQTSLVTWTCKWCEYIPGFQVLTVTSTDHLQAFVGFDIEAKQIVISFRGSHNTVDWLDDFDIPQVTYPGIPDGYVHQGYYDSWMKDLKPSVMKAATTLMDSHRHAPVLLTGHSLGAAVAQLAAIDIANYATNTSNDALIYSYNFGSPRWGNLVMAKYFESLVGYHFRLTNQHDPVPTLPYKHMGDYAEYHHSWTEIWYTSDDPLTYQQCDGSGEDPGCFYVGDDPNDHLHYLGVYESCEPDIY